MELRDDVKEAMAKALEGSGHTATARAIRAEDWDTATAPTTLLHVARAALAVIDEHEAPKRTGGTMKSIQEELKAAVSGQMWAEVYPVATRVDALNAIDAFFRDNLEEVEVAFEARGGSRKEAKRSWWARKDYPAAVYPDTTILVRKPEPEMKQVTRETLAVLKEHYEETPQRTPEGDKAVAEVDRLLKGR